MPRFEKRARRDGWVEWLGGVRGERGRRRERKREINRRPVDEAKNRGDSRATGGRARAHAAVSLSAARACVSAVPAEEEIAGGLSPFSLRAASTFFVAAFLQREHFSESLSHSLCLIRLTGDFWFHPA